MTRVFLIIVAVVAALCAVEMRVDTVWFVAFLAIAIASIALAGRREG